MLYISLLIKRFKRSLTCVEHGLPEANWKHGKVRRLVVGNDG